MCLISLMGIESHSKLSEKHNLNYSKTTHFDSIPVMLKVPVTYLSLKAACRGGLSDDQRAYWWPMLPTITKDQDIQEYPDIEGDASRLSGLTKFEPITTNSDEGKFNVVMTAVKAAMNGKNGVKDVVLIETLMRIICQQISNIEVCHLIGCDITSKTNKYVYQESCSSFK